MWGEGRNQRRYQGFVWEGMLRLLEDPLKKVVASTVLGTGRFIKAVRERYIKKGELASGSAYLEEADETRYYEDKLWKVA